MLLTYEEYEKLEEIAMETELPDDFVFPEEKDFESLLMSTDGILTMLEASCNTPTDQAHKGYLQALNQAMNHSIVLVDQEEMDEIQKCVPIGRNKDEIVKEKVAQMNFHAEDYGFYPTKPEVDEYLVENTEENLAFLYWMMNVPDEKLTLDSRRVKQYAAFLFQSRTARNSRINKPVKKKGRK